MQKLTAVSVLAVGVALTGVAQSPQVRQEAFKVEGWPLKKSWGPLRSVIQDGRGPKFIFEDAAGTIRVVAIDFQQQTAEVVGEMKRQ